MPPLSRRGEHQWTRFELQAMISLIARGAHLEDRGKRTDTAHDTRSKTYDNFANLFNEAINGKFNFAADIDKGEIIQMLDRLMKNRKNVIGKNGLVERQRVGRITRTLRLAWERTDGRSFDGTVSEWEGGRKEKLIKMDMITRGLISREDLAVDDDASGHVGGDDISSSMAVNTYTSVPKVAPAAYGRKYTPRRKLPVTVGDAEDPSSYLNRQLEKVHAVTSMSRAPDGRGKKNQLSSACIEADDYEDIFASVAPMIPMTPITPIARPQRVLAASTITKRNDALMNSLAAFAVQPSKIVKNGKLGWVSGGATIAVSLSPESPGIAGGGRAGASEVVKLKRPGREARTTKIADAEKTKAGGAWALTS